MGYITYKFEANCPVPFNKKCRSLEIKTRHNLNTDEWSVEKVVFKNDLASLSVVSVYCRLENLQDVNKFIKEIPFDRKRYKIDNETIKEIKDSVRREIDERLASEETNYQPSEEQSCPFFKALEKARVGVCTIGGRNYLMASTDVLKEFNTIMDVVNDVYNNQDIFYGKCIEFDLKLRVS